MRLIEEIEKLETWNFIEEEVNKNDVLDIVKKHMLTNTESSHIQSIHKERSVCVGCVRAMKKLKALTWSGE